MIDEQEDFGKTQEPVEVVHLLATKSFSHFMLKAQKRLGQILSTPATTSNIHGSEDTHMPRSCYFDKSQLILILYKIYVVNISLRKIREWGGFHPNPSYFSHVRQNITTKK